MFRVVEIKNGKPFFSFQFSLFTFRKTFFPGKPKNSFFRMPLLVRRRHQSVECHLPGPNNHHLSNRARATLLILSRSTLLISQHVVPPVLCVPRQSVNKAELLLLSMLAMIYAAGTPLVWLNNLSRDKKQASDGSSDAILR